MLVIAFDDNWDALFSDMAAMSCWSLPAKLVVNEDLEAQG